MGEVDGSFTEQSYVVTERRYWRRIDPGKAWWPGGLLPLLGLILLFLWGLFKTAPNMQSQVQDDVARQLAANGVVVKTVNADGQGVEVEAVAEASQEAVVRAMAKGTECDTWAGPLVCPTQVSVLLDNPTVKAPPEKPRFHDFTVRKSTNGLTVVGEVPDAEIKKSILAEARSVFDTVVDQLTISNKKATTGYPLAATRAIAVLENMERGVATWDQGVFGVSGLVLPENELSVRNLFGLSDSAPNLGSLELQVAKSAQVCNESFKTSLQQSTIQFRTGSATISQASQPLLQQLSELAKQCPGSLIIEGHTDNVGGDDSNQVLSQQRADAVRNALTELGVDEKRLRAVGFGESKPIASNETPTGRAKNRRIVIAIAQSE